MFSESLTLMNFMSLFHVFAPCCGSAAKYNKFLRISIHTPDTITSPILNLRPPLACTFIQPITLLAWLTRVFPPDQNDLHRAQEFISARTCRAQEFHSARTSRAQQVYLARARRAQEFHFARTSRAQEVYIARARPAQTLSCLAPTPHTGDPHLHLQAPQQAIRLCPLPPRYLQFSLFSFLALTYPVT